jgi:cytochrome c5
MTKSALVTIGFMSAAAFAAPALADGKAVYAQTCAACHAAGVAGAPKAGDKGAWSPRIGGGRDALIVSVLKGKGAMPPKGGNASLSDDDVKSAVDYLIAQVK